MKTQREIEFEKFMEQQVLRIKLEHKIFMTMMAKRFAIGIVALTVLHFLLNAWSAWMIMK